MTPDLSPWCNVCERTRDEVDLFLIMPGEGDYLVKNFYVCPKCFRKAIKEMPRDHDRKTRLLGTIEASRRLIEGIRRIDR